MRVTVISWLTTALLLTQSSGGERSSKQLFYTTYLYPSSSSSGSLRSAGSSSSAGINNAFYTPQIAVSPLHTLWSSFGDQKGRQTASLMPVSNANHNQAYPHQQQLRQQVLWSPSLPMGASSYYAAPLQHHHSGLTAAGGTTTTINNGNNYAGALAASKNIKHASLSSSSPPNAQFSLLPQQQIGHGYQIHTSSQNGNSPNHGMPIIGYVNVPMNPSYNIWSPYSSLVGSSGQNTIQNYLQSSALTPSSQNWNLPLKSYEQIHNSLLSNSIVPTTLHQQAGGQQIKNSANHLKGFQRGHVEALPAIATVPHTKSAFAYGNNNGFSTVSGNFIRGHIESKLDFHTAVTTTDIRNIAFIVASSAGQGNVHDHLLSSTGSFNRGAVEHRFPGLSTSSLQAITYDAPTKNVICYFASWSYYRKREGQFIPENADPTLCTHIIYAFARLDKSKFAIKESDPFIDNNKCKYSFRKEDEEAFFLMQ